MALAFEQQPKESDKAFAAFAMYLSLGAQRSLDAVRQKLGKSARLIQRWSSRWQWLDRVAAHAEYLSRVEREATEALARGKSAEWLTRQQALRETEWEMHEKCIAAARRGLAAYMEREKVYANLSDIARMLEIASKLGRLATGLGTEGDRPKDDQPTAMRVEVTVALEKIYGVAAPPAKVIEAEVIEEKKKEEGREKSA
jgi:hypothetical protein